MATTTTGSPAADNKARAPKARPVHEVRMGRVRAAVWENQTETGVRFNVTLSRLYKDGDQWKDSASLGRDDLPLAIRVLEKVHDWIFEQGANGHGHGASSAEGGDEIAF